MAFQYGAALAAFLAAGSTPGHTVATTPPAPQQQQIAVPVIEPVALKTMMNSSVRFVLVDVRQPDEFSAGHIDGAMLMPLDKLAATYSKLPKDVQLVVYCRAGHRSATAVNFLLAHGYGRAVSLNGGFLAWTALVK
jgi:phage shock protein E